MKRRTYFLTALLVATLTFSGLLLALGPEHMGFNKKHMCNKEAKQLGQGEKEHSFTP